MKKMLFFASAALALLASCSTEDKPEDKSSFGLSPVICNVKAAGGTVELKITGKEAWTVELTDWSTENKDWCQTEATEGEGEFTLKLVVEQASSLTDSRSVVVEVSNGTKTHQSKIIQEPLQLGEGEVLIQGLDGKGRIWSVYNLADKGKFETDIEATSAVFQFNRNKAWPFDPSKNGGAFGGATPSGEGMVPVEGFVDACKAYSEPHRTFDKDDPSKEVDDPDAWDDAKEGGLFIPVSGWISDGGYTDRTWLYTLWGATSHNDNLAGLYLTSYNDYCDHWGWGDGHKNYATVVRCIKK